jgi:hypothetical protein
VIRNLDAIKTSEQVRGGAIVYEKQPGVLMLI